MHPYQDRSDPGNSEAYRSGRDCIDCGKPAGTWWSPYWCVDCNIRRMDRIDQQLNEIVAKSEGSDAR